MCLATVGSQVMSQVERILAIPGKVVDSPRLREGREVGSVENYPSIFFSVLFIIHPQDSPGGLWVAGFSEPSKKYLFQVIANRLYVR